MSQNNPFATVRLAAEEKFPHIEGNCKGWFQCIEHSLSPNDLAGTVQLEGTVKLDGAHADIVLDLTHEDVQSVLGSKTQKASESLSTGGLADALSEASLKESLPPKGLKPRFHSRNAVVSSMNSIYDFPTSLEQQSEELQALKIRVLKRFCELHLDEPLQTHYPLILAGEWIGAGVQKGAGVCHLYPRRFVLLAVSINGVWQRDAEFRNIEAPAIGVYNIFRAPSYEVEFDLNNLSEDNPAIRRMFMLSDEIEQCCPFALAMGVSKEKCRGEGIVWKIGTPQGRSNPKLWFKTRGKTGHQKACGKTEIKVKEETDEVIKARYVKTYFPRLHKNGLAC